MPHRQHPLEAVAEMFQTLGIDFVSRLKARPQEAVQVFEAAKTEAKRVFKNLAMEHHPDRGGDEEHFKEITAAWSRLEKVKLKPRPRPQHVTVVVNLVRSRDTTTTNTTSTADYWGAW